MPWTCINGHQNNDANTKCARCGVSKYATTSDLPEAEIEELVREEEERLTKLSDMGRRERAQKKELIERAHNEAISMASKGMSKERIIDKLLVQYPGLETERVERVVTAAVNLKAKKSSQKKKGGQGPTTVRGWLNSFRGDGAHIDIGTVVTIMLGILGAYGAFLITQATLGFQFAGLLFAGIVFFVISIIFPEGGELGVIRALLRFLAFILMGVAFIPVNSVAVLIVFFIGYFSMPMHVHSGQPGEVAMAALRMIMGFAIALTIYVVFNGGNFVGPGGAARTLAFAMGFMTLGLMWAPPKQEGGQGSGITIINKMGEGKNAAGAAAGITGFGFLLGYAGLIADNAGFIMFVLYSVLGISSVIIAWTVHDEERGYIGAPLVILFVFVFLFGSATIQDTAGQAAFGAYWPSVQNSIDEVSEAFTPFQQTGNTLGTGFECIADPIGCQQRFSPDTQTQETIRAVEVTQFSVLGESRITRIKQDVQVLMEIRNDGDRRAEDLEVNFDLPVLGTGALEEDVGDVTVNCPIDHEDNTERSCVIPQLFPQEPTQVVAEYSLDLTQADQQEFRGNFVNFDASLRYGYNVSAGLDVTLMNGEFYDELARNDRLDITVAPTTDTGGPVRYGIGIFNNRMPIRAGLDSAPIVVEFTNQGNGQVTQIQDASIDISDVTPEGGQQTCSTPDDFSFTVSEDNPIESPREGGETSSRSTCLIPLREVDQETQSTRITGQARYTYSFNRNLRAQVAFGTGHLCTCSSDGEQVGDPITVGPGFCNGDDGEYNGEGNDCQVYCEDTYDGASGACEAS